MKTTPKINKPSIKRTGATLVLIFIWLSLISFTIISATEPAWLKKFSHFGRTDEASGMKDYGDNFLRQKNYAMAIAQYQKALQIKPDYWGAIINIAAAYNLSGDSQQSLKVLREALKMDSKWKGTVYYDIADILEKQGKKDLALEYCLKSLDTEVEQDHVNCRLGVLYLDAKRYEDASLAFEKALQIQTDPRTPYLKMLKSGLTIYESNEENLPIIEQMLKDSVNIADLNAYDLETVKKINDSNPEIAKTHNYLGLIYSNRGNIDKAIEHFEQSQRIWPDNIDARNNLKLLRQKKK